MTLPAAISHHVHITEREVAHTWPDGKADDARWEDCGYVSLIEFIRLAYRHDLPTTHAFVELIRSRVEGPSGGSTPDQLVAAARTIGATGPGTTGIALKGVSASGLWSVLKPGTVGCIAGSMGAFPAGHQLRRWDPAFAGGHQVMVARVDSQDRVWWCDPLAPQGTGYEGQWVLKADLFAFVTKLNSTSFVAPLKAVPVQVPAPTPAPAPVPVPAPAPAPVPAPIVYTQAQVDSLVAGQKATDQNVTAAAVNKALEDATAAERQRIRILLGI